MTPDSLRQLSWRTFMATIVCGVAGIVLLAAVPNPGFRSATDPSVRFLAGLAFALMGIAALANVISLIAGAVAWSKGTKRCGWIVVCAIVLLLPAALWIAM